MTGLFSNKWTGTWGDIADANGVVTDNFMEWYHETESLTDKQWAYGMSRVEQKVNADIAHQREPWPPATPKMFCIMCNPPKSEIAACAGQAAQSQKRHPNLVERDKRERLAIEHPESKGKAKKAGNDAVKSIMDMF